MADKSTVCTICDERHLYKQSTDWCIECEQALCTECKEFHAISKASRNHATIPVTDYQTLHPSILSVGSYCSDHDEKYQMFCHSHDKLLCPQCTEGHLDCKDLIALSKITKNVKTSETFRETEQCLVDISDNFLNIEDKLKDKIKLLNDQKEIILSEINQIRQKINEHLDQIEAVIKKEVLDIEQSARKDLETALTLLKEKKENNSSSIHQLKNMIKHATNLQTFFTLRQISGEITTTETFLQSIIDNGHLDKLALELSVNEIFRNIQDKIATFGSVRVIRNPSEFNLVKQKKKQAQLVGVQSASIQNIKLKLTHNVKTNLDTIRGCGILLDGRLIFCDHSPQKRLVVTDTDDKLLCQVAVQTHGAFDVTCISNVTVALTTGYFSPYGITIIDINSRKILKFIATDNHCYGITSVNGSLVYCAKGKGIEMMDINGENTTNIVKCDLPHYCYIASYKNKLYYTNLNTSTVTCCDMKGNTIWTFTDKNFLNNSRGISVDNDGHVYVVCDAGNTVIVLSADGQNSRQILSKENGLHNAAAIHYDRSRKELLVANFQNNYFLYKV